MPIVSADAWLVFLVCSVRGVLGVEVGCLVDGQFCWFLSVAEDCLFVAPVRGVALFALLESLILAQDERWRRA